MLSAAVSYTMAIGYAKYQACSSFYSIKSIVRREAPYLIDGAELVDLGPAMAPLELNEDGTPNGYWPVRQIRAEINEPGRIKRDWLVVVWFKDDGGWSAMHWPANELERIPGAVERDGEWIIPEPKRVMG